MFARVSTYQGEAEDLVEGFSGQTDALEKVDGFDGAYFLIDRQSGKAMSVTLWESEAAMKESAEQANRMREEATQPSGASIQSVEGYEVAITAGGV
jgi:heme-degrading monooxygenase HmoA